MTQTEQRKVDQLIEVTEELLFACESMHKRLHGEPDVTGECRFDATIKKAKAMRSEGNFND